MVLISRIYNPLIIQDATELFRDSDFKAFSGVVEDGGKVLTIAAKECANQSRKFSMIW